jgi:hypothetical protein
MSVYLGSYGLVELRRSSELAEKPSLVNPGDVNPARRRFSFDFDAGFLNSGDQLEIRTTDGTNLDFVDATGWGIGSVQDAGHWYVHVDELGGVRLYDTFDKSIEGLQSQAIVLNAIARDIPIAVRITNLIPHILAQCTYFELNTSREAVDTTALGDEFRSQYSSLISGSGNFRAYWEYLPTYSKQTTAESAHYLLQLAIRTEVGSKFGSKFYLKVSNEIGDGTSIDDEIWYELEGVITQAGVNFSPDNAVEISADFVTTGPIRLLAKTTPSDKVLQEDLGDIRLEQDSTASLLQEDIA